jgi:AcrR family transcriptional regulator
MPRSTKPPARERLPRRSGYQRKEVREQLLLRTARDLFLAEGWDGFSVERIAEQMRTSRPLVYAHFRCKEEILLALALESKTKRLRMLELTLKFTGRPRERLTAVDLMEEFMARRDLPLEIFVTSARLRAKTSPERQQALRAAELRVQAIGAGIVREGVGAGDLTLPRHVTADDLYFALWACIWGGVGIERSGFPYQDAGIHHPMKTVRRAMLTMLDGFGWRPLTHEWDYRTTCRRVEREIFSLESFQKLVVEEGESKR